jgi:hypothetical protein
MDRFKHHDYRTHFATGDNREYIPVKMHDTALVFRFREDFPDRFQHTQIFVPYKQPYPCQTAFFRKR